MKAVLKQCAAGKQQDNRRFAGVFRWDHNVRLTPSIVQERVGLGLHRVKRVEITSTFIAALLCGCAAAMQAQEPEITPETHVDAATIEQWLHGNDPRLVAWAADFARRGADGQLIGEIPAVLEHTVIPSPQDGDRDQRLAVLALLDAVIQQQDVQVSAAAIARVATAFPAQALVLISRLPFAESRSILNDWSYGVTPSWDTRRLERVASMMLAQHPDPEFVERIAAAAGQTMTVHVASSDSGYGGGSGCCGDSLGGPPRSGWPQVYNYGLTENDPQETPLSSGSQLVIDLADDRIVARRFAENGGWGSCNGVENLDDVTRHRLLAYWLGMKPVEMSWQPTSEVAIVWTDQASYEGKLGALVNEERKKMVGAVKELESRSLLSEEQVDSISPKITVSIECDITPCPVK